jgi:H+/gluconate symporter-like permease
MPFFGTRGRRIPSLRASMDAGANASVLPVLSVASLVGFGAVVAAMPAFGVVREWVLNIGGGPLLSVAVATNVLAALTGSASGGLTIALDALGPTYMTLAAENGIDPGLMHRIAVIGAGTLDTCRTTARSSRFWRSAAARIGRATWTSSWWRS